MLRAFGTNGPAQRLPGGQGTSWRAGSLVLKPTGDAAEACWLAETLTDVPQDGFRVARPARAGDGRWVVEGWTAARWVAGEPGPVGHWQEVLAAGRAFHRAVRDAPRPELLDTRGHWWARADRSTWDEAEPPTVPGLDRLRATLHRLTRPVTDRPQLVHGDLSGNVLLRDGLPPAVLDLSPYWRPPAFAEAIVVADGLLRWGEGVELMGAAGRAGEPSWLARGLLFRLDTLGNQLLDAGGVPTDRDLEPYVTALGLLGDAS